MVKRNQDIDEQCITNDDGELTVRDEDQIIVWKSYYGKHMNTSFVYDKNKFSEADTVSGPHLLINNDMNKE